MKCRLFHLYLKCCTMYSIHFICKCGSRRLRSMSQFMNFMSFMMQKFIRWTDLWATSPLLRAVTRCGPLSLAFMIELNTAIKQSRPSLARQGALINATYCTLSASEWSQLTVTYALLYITCYVVNMHSRHPLFGFNQFTSNILMPTQIDRNRVESIELRFCLSPCLA